MKKLNLKPDAIDRQIYNRREGGMEWNGMAWHAAWNGMEWKERKIDIDRLESFWGCCFGSKWTHSYSSR